MLWQAILEKRNRNKKQWVNNGINFVNRKTHISHTMTEGKIQTSQVKRDLIVHYFLSHKTVPFKAMQLRRIKYLYYIRGYSKSDENVLKDYVTILQIKFLKSTYKSSLGSRTDIVW